MPIDNPFYSAAAQGPYELHALGRFELEEGGVIPNLELAVATHGTLNEDRSNAVLIPTWFSGTHQTWEQVYIGPGRALDPEKYFIVIVNQIGNGLSTSPPYRVSAIGSPDALSVALEMPGGVLSAIRATGATTTLQELDDVRIEAVRVLPDLVHARVVEPDEEG